MIDHEARRRLLDAQNQADFDDETMDACLIAAGQRTEHYEMAAYGTLVAWAPAMGHNEAADLRQEALDEEKAADEKLSSLAEGGINQGAADATRSDEDEEATAVGAATRRRRRLMGRRAFVGGSNDQFIGAATRRATLATVATSLA